MAGMIEIKFLVPSSGGGEVSVPARSVSEEWQRLAIKEVGLDPDDFNVMHWPTGAANHATCWLLLLGQDLEAIQGSVNQFIPDELPSDREEARQIVLQKQAEAALKLKLGDILFDRMYLHRIVRVLCSEGTGVMFAVQMVDERYFWRTLSDNTDGLNISTDDKSPSRVYRSTENGSLPWNVGTAVDKLLKAVVSSADMQFVDQGEISIGYVRDLFAKGLPAVELIDRLLAMSGNVLCAHPNSEYLGTSKRYRVRPINSGLVAAANTIETYSSMLIAGGLFGSLGEATISTAKIIVQQAIGTAKDLTAEVPSTVEVLFPKSQKFPSKYSFNDFELGADQKWTIDRFHLETTSAGAPVPGNGKTVTIFDSFWAIYDEAELVAGEQELIDERLADIGRVYYRRFESGAGRYTFGGIIPIEIHPGCSCVQWGLTPFKGEMTPVTRVSSGFNEPIFGWLPAEKLGATTVHGTGLARVMPRPDGGLLIDVPVATVSWFFGRPKSIVPAAKAGGSRFYEFEEVALNWTGDIQDKPVWFFQEGLRSTQSTGQFAQQGYEAGNDSGTVKNTGVETQPPKPWTLEELAVTNGPVCPFAEFTDITGAKRYIFWAPNPFDTDCGGAEGPAEFQFQTAKGPVRVPAKVVETLSGYDSMTDPAAALLRGGF